MGTQTQPSATGPTTARTTRKVVDCRRFPSVHDCSLRISGTPDEVLRAAKQHAISVHGHADSPELERQIRSSMEDASD